MAGAFKVSVVAGDQVTGTLSAINKRLEALNRQAERSRAPWDRLQRNIGRFSRVTGIDKVAASIGGVARAGMAAFESAARIIEPLAAISGAASVAGMMRLALGWAQFGTALGNAAARAGVASDRLQLLQNAAQLAGVPAESLTRGLTSLRDNMVHAIGGQAPEVVNYLRRLGYSMADAKRFAEDTTRALPELADSIAAIKDPTLQAQVATALFGGAGEALLPWLRKGSAGIREYTERAAKYGAVTKQGVESANRLREAYEGLSQATAGLGYAVAQQIEPVIAPLLDQFRVWINANREWIATGIGDAVRALAAEIERVDWRAVGAAVVSVMRAVGNLVDALGGPVPAAEKVIGFFVLSWSARILGPILAVTRPLLGLPMRAAGKAVAATAMLGKIRVSPINFGKMLCAGLLAHDAMEKAGGSAGEPDSTDLLALGGAPGRAALVVHDGLSALDPDDGIGKWIDRNIPGAGWLDNAASRLGIGLGRSYERQESAPSPNPSYHAPSYGVPDQAYDGGKGQTRPQRNNNPADLEFHNQPGAVREPEGRFARFSTMADGVAAALHQALLYQDRDGLKSVRSMMLRAGPRSDNPQIDSEIEHISKELGVSPDAPINLHDPAMAKRYVRALGRQEGAVPDEDSLDRGVEMRLHAEPSAPTPALPANPGTMSKPGSASPAPIAGGPKLDVGVTVTNAPDGARTSTVASGDALGDVQVRSVSSGLNRRRDL